MGGNHGDKAPQNPRGLRNLPRHHPQRETHRDTHAVVTGEPGTRKRVCRVRRRAAGKGPAQQRRAGTSPCGLPCELVEALLVLDEIADTASRRQLVLLLPPHVRAVVPDGANPRLHVLGLLRACSRFGPSGRDWLTTALKLVLPPEIPATHHVFTTFDRHW